MFFIKIATMQNLHKLQWITSTFSFVWCCRCTIKFLFGDIVFHRNFMHNRQFSNWPTDRFLATKKSDITELKYLKVQWWHQTGVIGECYSLLDRVSQVHIYFQVVMWNLHTSLQHNPTCYWLCTVNQNRLAISYCVYLHLIITYSI